MQDLIAFTPLSGSHVTSRNSTPKPLHGAKQVPKTGMELEDMDMKELMACSQLTMSLTDSVIRSKLSELDESVNEVSSRQKE